jgi:hypothetical protein
MRDGQELTAIAGASFQGSSTSVLAGVAGGVVLSLGRVATLDVGYRLVRGLSGPSAFQLKQATIRLGARF